MRVLVTGADGFLGRNLCFRLRELGACEVVGSGRGDSMAVLAAKVAGADAIVHLAGVNRPEREQEFTEGNALLTERLCEFVAATGRHVPLLLASSIQAERANAYGISKRAAEKAVAALADRTGNPAVIYRLVNVFGKWSRPNYNSVVATFCHNIANGLPVDVRDPSAPLTLVYVDDVVTEWVNALGRRLEGLQWGAVEPTYATTPGELADQIRAFAACRDTLVVERVGAGLARALYATYMSFVPPSGFVYDLASHTDARGVFVEMLKTTDSGQFSFFTSRPGATRGGHYHHSKTEKFLVIRGRARFGFRNLVTGQTHEVTTSGEKPQVVETAPGWTHDITNIGSDEMVVLLWANEVFDRARPDTVACKV